MTPKTYKLAGRFLMWLPLLAVLSWVGVQDGLLVAALMVVVISAVVGCTLLGAWLIDRGNRRFTAVQEESGSTIKGGPVD